MSTTTQEPLIRIEMTDCNDKPITVGAIMRNNQRGRYIQKLRDDYLSRMNSERVTRKQWLDDALAKRFIVTDFGRGKYCAEIRYTIVGSTVTGACMANELEIA